MKFAAETTSASTGISRRIFTRGAAWSVPVIGAAIAVPAAAASVGPAALMFSVTPLVDVYAPYGSQLVVVSNTSGQDYAGPLSLRTDAWQTTAPFTIPGATMTVEDGGSANVWTIADASIPADQSLNLPLSWAGPYPMTAEPLGLTVIVDPTRASVAPAGDTTIASPYQLLWYAVLPGGQGNAAGTSGFFIGNTTESEFASNTTARVALWPFPIEAVRPMSVDGVGHAGRRVYEAPTILGRYDDIPVTASARVGKVDFIFDESASTPSGPQGSTNIISLIPASGSLSFLGDVTMYSPYTPAP